ncbi:MAG: hypothetical protein ACPG5W_03795 [Flavobacteriales bacterium]
MARVKFGAVVTGIKGNIGGTTFQGGRSGGVAKNLGLPKRSVSLSQTFKKQQLSQQSGGWRDLTVLQRDSWVLLASTLTRLNKFGDPYTPTGYQIFMEFNLNLRSIGNTTILSTAPIIVSEPVADSWDLSVDIGSSSIRPAWNYISGAADWSVTAYMYWNQSNGVFQARGNQTWSAVVGSITTGNLNLWTAFTKLGVNTSIGASQLAVTIRIVNRKTGQAVAPFQLISPVS